MRYLLEFFASLYHPKTVSEFIGELKRLQDNLGEFQDAESQRDLVIHSAEELTARVNEAAAYPILKIKLGTDRDAEIMQIVRAAAPNKVIRVDANAAWDANQTLRMMMMLMA